jgi:hypothetical protein
MLDIYLKKINMEYKLFDILKSTILSEGRKEDAMAKWGANKELVDNLSSQDPSGNNKYLDWMVGMVHNKVYDINDIVNTVVKFHKIVNRIKPEEIKDLDLSDKISKSPKNIESYTSINEIMSVINFVESKTTESEIKKEADKIFEDENILVVVPKTVRSSCKYGAGSRWCIAGKTSSDGYNTHFDSYSQNNVFYFITDKTTNQNDNPTHYKYALQYHHEGKKTWWDAEDKSHSTQPEFMNSNSGSKALAVIDTYHKKAVGDKFNRALESFILQPSLGKYSDFKSHLNKTQINKVKQQFISDVGYTFDVFKTLLQDLTDKEKEMFLKNIVNLNINEFNNIKSGLNKTQLYYVIKNNPQILNNVNILEEISSLFNDDEKRELINTMDTSKITNTDTKSVIMRWRMSKEEVEKHNSRSQYVFIYNDDDERIEQLLKVDPLDPKSYSKIHLIKMKTAQNPRLKLHSIITEKDLLDDYLESGVRSTDIPENVLSNIMKNSKEVGKK